MSKKQKPEEYPNVRYRGKGYTYRYSLPIIKPDGKKGRKQKETTPFPTAEEAYKAGLRIEDEIATGRYVDETNMLYIAWAEKAIDIYAVEHKLKKRTIDGKRAHLKHAKVYFAGVKLKDITPYQVRQFFVSLREEHELGQSAINGIFSTICMTFNLAKTLKMIEVDPTDDAVKPSVKQTFTDLEALENDVELPEYLEKEQVIDLLRAVKQKAAEETTPKQAFGARQLYRIIYLLTYTGMRIGEICSLEDRRADTAKKTIRIISTLYVPEGGIRNYELTTPKNDPSIRTVDYSERVAAIIEQQRLDVKAFRLMLGDKCYKERSFLFIGYRDYPGYPLHPATLEYTLKGVLKSAGIPTSITPHSLRHTYTSLNAEAGATLEDIQKQLGHSTDEMTKRVYYHVTESRRRANVDKLDSLMADLMSTL